MYTEDQGIDHIVDLSKSYSSYALSRKYLTRFLNETVVSNIAVYSEKCIPCAYTLMSPHLLKEWHYLVNNDYNFTCNINHWGRDPLVTDKRLVAFFTKCIYEWLGNVSRKLVTGEIEHRPGSFISPTIHIPKDDIFLTCYFRIKLDPEDYPLMTELHKSKALIVKSSKKINDECIIFSGLVNINHDVIKEVFHG